MKNFRSLLLLCFLLGLGMLKAQTGEAVYHQLRPGENLIDLAAAYETSMDQLMIWNRYSPSEMPKPGDWVQVGLKAPQEASFIAPVNAEERIQSLNETKFEVTEEASRSLGEEGSFTGELSGAEASRSLDEHSYLERVGPEEISRNTQSLGPADSRNIRQPIYYAVKKGDTFYKVSRKFNVGVEELEGWNAPIDIGKLKVGQELMVGYKDIADGPQAHMSSQPGMEKSLPPASQSRSEFHAPSSVIPQAPAHHSYRNIHSQSRDELELKRLALIHDLEEMAVDLPILYAVVVGIADYPSVRKLKYTDDDAFNFYSYLRSVEGGAMPRENCKVLVDGNATRENVLRSMRELYLKARPEDYVVFYFAGHGVENALIPYDCDGHQNLLMHSELQAILDQSPSKHKMVIADACYAGGMAKFSAKHVTNDHIDSFHDGIDNELNVAFTITSCSSNELSYEFQGVHQGVFTYYMIEGLEGGADQNGDRMVTLAEIYGYVSEQVGLRTNYKQKPRITGTFDKEAVLTYVRKRKF